MLNRVKQLRQFEEQKRYRSIKNLSNYKDKEYMENVEKLTRIKVYMINRYNI